MKRILLVVAAAVFLVATLVWSETGNSLRSNIPELSTPTQDWAAAKAAYAHWLENGTASPAEKDLISQYLQHAGPRSSGGSLDNSGGPDGYGYRFADNSDPDTATFDWIELRGMAGTVWVNNFSSHDDGTADIPLSINFPFYGGVYSNATLCVNGFIQFTTTSGDFSNECLPSTIAGPTISVFWDDLHLDNGGIPTGTDVVGYRNFGNYTVIEWDSVGRFSGTGSYKFQALLFSDGRIKLQYQENGSGDLTSNTVGIQAGSAGPSLQYRCEADGFAVYPGRAIWFFGPSGLTHDFGGVTVTSPLPGEVSAGQSLNVVAQVTNYGSTTESSPVKYRLDNGAPVTETTGSLSTGQIETHAFATPVVMPGSGRHMLKIWTDLGTDENRTNDTLAVSLHVGCADYSVTAPGTWSGTTCGEGDDSGERPSTDVVYAVTIPQGGMSWTFSTCDAGTDFDSYLILMTGCPSGTEIASNDDNCSLQDHGLNSTLSSGILDAGTYYLAVEAFAEAQCGNYTLTVEAGPPCVPCQGSDLIEVAENPADTSYWHTDPDGGCNSEPDQFSNINFNQTVCGVGFFYDVEGVPYRDTDWYSFTVAQAETVTVTFWSDFAQQVAILNAVDCSNIQLLLNQTTDIVCEYQYAFAYVPAGSYALFFAPSFSAGDFAISDSMHYRVSIHHGTLASDDNISLLPSSFSLSAYPNPFNPETRISFALPHAADVKLAVYDITGRLVSVLAEQRYEAGTHELRFNGGELPSGLYFARLESGEFNATQKLMLMK